MSACAAVRSHCGWHVAPIITETLIVRGAAQGGIILPTLFLRDVTALTDNEGVVYTVADLEVDRNGWVYGNLPGYSRTLGRSRRFTVTFAHGHNTCPDDLLAVVRSWANAYVLPAGGNFQAGPFSFSGTGVPDTELETLDRYTLPGRP